MRIINNIAKPIYTLTIGSMLLGPTCILGQKYNDKDTFELTSKEITTETAIPPKGTENPSILLNAPNPSVKIAGKISNAEIVIDLNKNVLYHYDKDGNAIKAYSVASGSKKTPTHTGIRRVSHIETFPYKNAPSNSKRRKNPRDYGPKIIILDKVDQQTGDISSIGEFIHGNRNPSCLGNYVSHGCIRMDNEVIQDLSSKVKRGSIVLIKR